MGRWPESLSFIGRSSVEVGVLPLAMAVEHRMKCNQWTIIANTARFSFHFLSDRAPPQLPTHPPPSKQAYIFVNWSKAMNYSKYNRMTSLVNNHIIDYLLITMHPSISSFIVDHSIVFPPTIHTQHIVYPLILLVIQPCVVQVK